MKNKKKKIVIIGARLDGHAGVVLDVINRDRNYELVGFIDNTPELQGKTVAGKPVLGATDNLDSLDILADCVHLAIGDNAARGKLFQILRSRKIPVATLIHPTAVISSAAEIGEGCFIGPQAVVNTGTVIADAVIINSAAIIEHDNNIGFAVHMAPGVKTSGRVRVDEFAFVGVGSTILPDTHIGSGAMIGAGSTVVKDVSPKTTVIGYAAKKHTKNIYVDTVADVNSNKIYVAQPTLPDYPLLDEKFRDIVSSRMLSNFAKYSNQLEAVIETGLDVKKALTFPNGTSALMLSLKALELEGEVILPSFTFSSTGHAVIWNGLVPVFADIDRRTFNVDPQDVERKITSRTSAIMAVHVFGNPADIEALETIARKHKLKLVFDSAHALGSKYKGKPIGGFGDVECFSLSGTKVITSAEGGIATSNNKQFMRKMHLGRNYGAGPDYDCQYIGLNGKMSEFHAAIALESYALLGDFLIQRNKLVELYKLRLAELPGISFQQIQTEDGCTSTFKDFAILIDKDAFGINRDQLIKLLNKQGIFPKKYFYPPLHRMKAYQSTEMRAENLVNTEYIADNIVCLPIYSHMSEDTVEKICFKMHQIWHGKGKK